MVTWLNETQRDPRLNEILHPLYTMDEDSEMCIFTFLKDLYAKVDIDDTNLMKVTMTFNSIEDDVIQIQSFSMSDPPLSDTDFENRMAWVRTTLENFN